MARRRGKLGTRLNQGVSRVTSKLEDYQWPLGVLVLAIGAFLAYTAFTATTGPPFQPRYEIDVTLPADAPIMRKGQEIRIGGKLAGLVSAVEPDRETGGTTVSMNITKTEFRPLPADSSAYVRVHSIVYRTWIEVLPGQSDEELVNGDKLAEPAGSGTDLLEVVQLFDAQTREDLQRTVVNLGFGVAGRGTELNAALANIVPLSRNLRRQLDAATRDPGAIGRLISGAAATSSGLRGVRSDDVAGLIASADETVSTVAGRSEELRSALRLLPPFEDQFLTTAPVAEQVLADLAVTANELEPTVASLNTQLPTINELLSLGDTLRDETGVLADAADPVLAAAKPVIVGLFPTITTLGPLNADLDKLIKTVEPYADEIDAAGTNAALTTGTPFDAGLAPGEPAGRVVPVLTPHRCSNPLPDPGEAMTDRC